jgi:hypothetical protein
MLGPFMLSSKCLFMRRSLGLCSGCRRGVFSDRSIQHRVELCDVNHLGVAFLGDDEDTRRLSKADALAQSVVSMDLGGKEAAGVDNERHYATVRLEILLREGVEVFLRRDRGLICEYGAAILFSGLRRDLILDVACDDGGVKAPDVHLERKVMTNERDLVLVHGCVDDREGAGAGGALEILELVDGDPGANGGAKHRGVFEGGLGEGGDADWEREQQSGG